jgi:hypothetical protein
MILLKSQLLGLDIFKLIFILFHDKVKVCELLHILLIGYSELIQIVCHVFYLSFEEEYSFLEVSVFLFHFA